MLRLAVIGLGNRAASVIRMMRDVEPKVQVVAVASPDRTEVSCRLDKMGISSDSVQFHPSEDKLLEFSDNYDGVLIGTRCYLHTPMACKVAPTGLPLYLEKPVAITAEQLNQLTDAFAGREETVLVSFPLRVTPLFATALDIVRSGRLGPVNQIQANNNVPYGGGYFSEWHRNYDETGGLWLQKATHDFDYLTHLLDARPLMIAATATQKIYGGQMPHDLRCSACDQIDTCLESHQHHRLRGDTGGMSARGDQRDHLCAFSGEIRNQDAGSALILYEGGAHVTYAQNFISRRSAAKRGAVITGHRATVEFDWYTNVVRAIDHMNDRVDEITVKTSSGHSGGDHELGKNFVQIMRGEAQASANLRDGLLSAAMCLAARESTSSQTFQPIVPPGVRPEELPDVTSATEIPV